MKVVSTLILTLFFFNLQGKEYSDSSFIEVVFYDTTEVKEIRIENKNCVYLDFYNVYINIGFDYIYESYRSNTRAYSKYCKRNETIDNLIYYSFTNHDYYYTEDKHRIDSVFKHYQELLENVYIKNVDTLRIIGFPGVYNYSKFLEDNVSGLKIFLSIQHSGYLEITGMKDLDYKIEMLELTASMFKIDLKNLEKFNAKIIVMNSSPFCRHCVNLINIYEKQSELVFKSFFQYNYIPYFLNYLLIPKIKKRYRKKFFPNSNYLDNYREKISTDYHKESSAYEEIQKFKVGGL